MLIDDDYVGAVMGDLSTRRARVLGTEPVGRGRTLVKAETPQLELVRYATELRSLSHGTGTFSPPASPIRRDAAARGVEGAQLTSRGTCTASGHRRGDASLAARWSLPRPSCCCWSGCGSGCGGSRIRCRSLRRQAGRGRRPMPRSCDLGLRIAHGVRQRCDRLAVGSSASSTARRGCRPFAAGSATEFGVPQLTVELADRSHSPAMSSRTRTATAPAATRVDPADSARRLPAQRDGRPADPARARHRRDPVTVDVIQRPARPGRPAGTLLDTARLAVDRLPDNPRLAPTPRGRRLLPGPRSTRRPGHRHRAESAPVRIGRRRRVADVLVGVAPRIGRSCTVRPRRRTASCRLPREPRRDRRTSGRRRRGVRHRPSLSRTDRAGDLLDLRRRPGDGGHQRRPDGRILRRRAS